MHLGITLAAIGYLAVLATPASAATGACDYNVEKSPEAVTEALRHHPLDGRYAALQGLPVCIEYDLPELAPNAGAADEMLRNHGWYRDGSSLVQGTEFVSFIWPSNVNWASNDQLTRRPVRRVFPVRVAEGSINTVFYEFGSGFGRGQFNYSGYFAEGQGGWLLAVRARTSPEGREYGCPSRTFCTVPVRFTTLSFVSKRTGAVVAEWDLSTVSRADKVTRRDPH
jgi:hypothetical protein